MVLDPKLTTLLDDHAVVEVVDAVNSLGNPGWLRDLACDVACVQHVAVELA